MSTVELDMWRFTFADAVPAAKADGNQGNVLDLEVYWTLGRGAVIAAWGYRNDLERCVAALAPKLGGNEGFATRLAQTYREMAIGSPRRLGENEKLPPLPADWDFDAAEPADAIHPEVAP